MNHCTEIYKAIRYIEDNLQENLNVQKVADAAGFSIFHFSRLFNQLIRHSPYDYIMRRRLSEACKRLLTSEIKIIDLAYDYQFNNPETFSRAFRKMFGILPGDARKQKQLNDFILKEAISIQYLEYLNNIKIKKPEFIKLEELKITGLCSFVEDNLELINQLLNKLKNTLAKINEKKQNEKLAALYLYENKKRSVGNFLIMGSYSESIKNISEIFITKKIPPQTYLKINYQGTLSQRLMLIKYITQSYLPKSNYELSANYELELFKSKINNFSEKYKSEIYFPVNEG